MAEHSPTPWAADPDDREGYEWNIHIVQESDHDMRVCFMTSGSEAVPNAAFIIRCVNDHDELVAAIRFADTRAVSRAAYPHACEEDKQLRDLIDAALAKVEA
jgi:hypothetical protein